MSYLAIKYTIIIKLVKKDGFQYFHYYLGLPTKPVYESSELVQIYW